MPDVSLFPHIRPAEILLVEDNAGDVRLTKEALRDGRVLTNLNVVGDGEEALAFLRMEGRYADVKRPDLILLDLNLPKKNGKEVLADLKNDPSLKRIPVIILTTSRADEDILKTYDLHVNCYITKPVDFAQFTRVVRVIEDFWLTVVKLPNGLDRPR